MSARDPYRDAQERARESAWEHQRIDAATVHREETERARVARAEADLRAIVNCQTCDGRGGKTPMGRKPGGPLVIELDGWEPCPTCREARARWSKKP